MKKNNLCYFLLGVLVTLVIGGIGYGISAIGGKTAESAPPHIPRATDTQNYFAQQEETAPTPSDTEIVDTNFPVVPYPEIVTYSCIAIDYNTRGDVLDSAKTAHLTNTLVSDTPEVIGHGGLFAETKVLTSLKEYEKVKEGILQVFSDSFDRGFSPVIQFGYYSSDFPYSKDFFKKHDLLLVDFCDIDTGIRLRSCVKELSTKEETAYITIQLDGYRPPIFFGMSSPGGLYLIPVEKGTVKDISLNFEEVTWE